MLFQDVKVDLEDLRDLATCSLRYALHRRTYITKAISDAIRALDPAVFDRRVVSVMLTDIERYYKDRKMTKYPDDDCDKEAWDRLYAFLKEKEKGTAEGRGL